MHTRISALTGAALLLSAVIGTSMVASRTKPVESFNAHSLATPGEPLPIHAESTAKLQEIFRRLDYQWPPANLDAVPAVVLQSLPEDLAQLNSVSERKSLFLRSLLPIVLLENRRLREEHNLARLIMTQGLPPQGSEAYVWLADVARRMKLRGVLADTSVQHELLRRLDEVPLGLALAQAAIESGWGTSRFAREGNSLFGQWTYLTDQGIEPSERDADADHLVRAFPHLQDSVRAYMHNLNSSRAYREFRAARADMRTMDETLSSTELAQYLHRYSQRGQEYVEDLQKMINSQSLVAIKSLLAANDTEREARLSDRLPDDPQQRVN